MKRVIQILLVMVGLLASTQLHAIELLPTFGDIDHIHLPALMVQHADGDQSLQLRAEDTSYIDHAQYKETVIKTKDMVQPFFVTIHVRQWKAVDITETWYEIMHTEKKPVRLQRYDSGYLPIDGDDPHLIHLHGNWAGEAVPTIEPLTRGVKTIRNSDGARNAHLDAPEVMIALDGVPQENYGRVFGAALCWSGNFEIRVAATDENGFHFYAGIDPMASEYVLEPKQVFSTPHLAYTFSNEGMGGVSRAFHRWARTCGMLHNGNATRDILLNSWEGIYFDITEEKILAMMNDIAAFGGELFVMDDGWFGSKYQRNSDNAALGDWVVDTRKLPNGLEALTKAAKERHIKFGIWIEPEATNTLSELYEKHPGWVLQERGRELKLGRGGTQLVLDMTNPEVQDFVFSIVDNLLTKHPEIAYIKWDANASIQNYGSTYLPRDKQSNLYVDYHLGLVKTLERIRAKYPNVVIQNCASGGGRANYGLMPYFDEFWVSDNNDALQRVYIQWGTSYFFPSNAMAQHIGGSPYLMTGRTTPIKFRCDVAMSGRLGMELQPAHMTDEERQQCTVAFRDYKALRELIQLGNLYRLVSPYSLPCGEGRGEVAKQRVASLMYVSDTKDHAVLFAYGLSSFMKQASRRIRLAGLDPDRTYTLHEKNIRVAYHHDRNAWGEGEPCELDGKSFTGEYLMSVGLDIPLSTEYNIDYPSRIFELKSQSSPALIDRMSILAQQGVLFGHQDDPLYGVHWRWEYGRSDILESCGDYPAVIGFDLGGIEQGDSCNLDQVPFERMRAEIIEHHRRGGIITLSWHPRNPVTGGSSWDVGDSVLTAILNPGQVQDRFLKWLDRVGAFIASLADDKGDPIPLIFRPWHENNGTWFWWGNSYCSADEYKALWNMTQTRIRTYLASYQRNNASLVWCYSPNLQGGWTDSLFLSRYPGDKEVDMLGLDAYQWDSEQAYIEQTSADLSYLCSYGRRHDKLVALTECGRRSMPDPSWWTRVLLPLIKKYPLFYALVWRNSDEQEHYGPVPGTASADSFKTIYNDPQVLFLNDIAPSSFVKQQGGAFFLNGKKYTYVGANLWYGAILASKGQGGNRERLLAELDTLHAMGINNLRILVGSDGENGVLTKVEPTLQIAPGRYNDTILDGLDWLLFQMGKRDMKAVLYLNNAWEWSGGYGFYLEHAGYGHTPRPEEAGYETYMRHVAQFATSDSAQHLFYDYVRFILSRTNRYSHQLYIDDPAIMAWQIGNEPRAFGQSQKQPFARWLATASAIIRSMDKNHLISIGSEGIWGCEMDSALYDQLSQDPNIDYLTVHIWPYNWSWVHPQSLLRDLPRAIENTNDYLRPHIAIADRLRKPVVIEEFGFPRDTMSCTPSSPTVARDIYYQHIFSLVQSEPTIAGCNFWSWGGLAVPSHHRWQAGDDYTGDPAQEPQGLNSVFISDTTTLKTIRRFTSHSSSPLSLTFALPVRNNWTYDTMPVFTVTCTNASALPAEADVAICIATDQGQPVTTIRHHAHIPPLQSMDVDVTTHQPLSPGFYNAVCTANNQLVHDFVFAVNPTDIVSLPDKQADFEDFWTAAKSQLKSIDMRPVLTEIPTKSTAARKVYLVEFYSIPDGLSGEPVLIRGYYCEPQDGKKHPVIIHYAGYDSGYRPGGHDVKPYCPSGDAEPQYAEFYLATRGQYINNRAADEREPDGKGDFNNTYGDWFAFHFGDKDSYYYRGAFMDCVQAVRFMATRSTSDMNNIFAEGHSQGGAFTYAAAALSDYPFRAIAPAIAFLGDYPDYFKIAHWPANVAKENQQSMTDAELFAFLSYFDTKNLATAISCPVIACLGLQDDVCPPHTNIAPYNNLRTKDKRLVINPELKHQAAHTWYDEMMQFFQSHIVHDR